jgi:nucleotide-binding universal stress UspA family protein
MRITDSGARVTLENILYLTDFSEPSEAAIPFVTAIAREYDAKIDALHVLTPITLAYASPESAEATIEELEDSVNTEMRRLDSQLGEVPHETFIIRGESVWTATEQLLNDRQIDLLVVGTHGRTGTMKLLLGSVAEEIFRRASIPVLTVGPSARQPTQDAGRFHRVLFATDFTPEAQAATPYAISMAQENQARLLLLHVMPNPGSTESGSQDSVANVLHKLHELVTAESEIWCRPEPTVRFGRPADRILEVAAELATDLIVLGVRKADRRIGAVTHFGRTTAHEVVAHAPCPVLTIRG